MNWYVSRNALLFAAWLVLPCISSASYIDDAQCFGGAVPTVPVGRTAIGEVTTSTGKYRVTAWRQACQSDATHSVLLLQFQVLTGSPYAGSVSVYQAGYSYHRTQILVKNPRTTDGRERYLSGQLNTPITTAIVQQAAGGRFDPNGTLELAFPDSVNVTSFVELLPAIDAPASYWATVPWQTLTDMWWNPDENGTGLSIIQHGSNQLFIVWYTYDEAGAPLWLVWPGGTWSNGAFSGALYRTRGTAFSRPWNSTQFVLGDAVGSARLVVGAPDSISMSYQVGSASGTKLFTRQRY